MVRAPFVARTSDGAILLEAPERAGTVRLADVAVDILGRSAADIPARSGMVLVPVEDVVTCLITEDDVPAARSREPDAECLVGDRTTIDVPLRSGTDLVPEAVCVRELST
jgi:hypothetical protein